MILRYGRMPNMGHTSELKFVVAPLCGFMEDLVTAVIAEVFNTLSFCLKHSVKC